MLSILKQKEGIVIMRRKFLSAFLFLLLISFSVQAFAEDDFLYGVQIFNWPIDWNPASEKSGWHDVETMIGHAADIGFNIIRGGTQHNSIYTQVEKNGEHYIWGMKDALLPMLAEKNMLLDWVIVGSDSVNTGFTNPLEPADWQKYFRLAAQTVASMPNQPEVIYEIWNEPDLPGVYWLGSYATLANYYNTLLPGASQAIKSVNSSARIINGGIILGRDYPESEAYLQNAIAKLNAGEISMLAIHSHRPLDDFLTLWDQDNLLRTVPSSKIFLN